MSQKYYAVRKGMKTGIFRSWEECKACVQGFSGAEYKSFPTKDEAMAYMSNTVQKKRTGKEIYVDGSYNSGDHSFSYGVVVLGDQQADCYSQRFWDEELATMHNVAGEIMGARTAMQYALEEGLPEIIIYHDYEGIAKWCLGEWKTNKDGTKAYKAFYDEISKKVRIHFVKVTGHSNNKYNDMADRLAKEAVVTKNHTVEEL